MATALQAQLAQIAVNSTNTVDLKAQRKDHSRSLLYDPATAAKQDLDTLFDECSRHFRDLCGLDRRFAQYERTLFSEQSKEQDRSQLTAAQNKELDTIIESFLYLVAGRLQLRPALHCLEWLVRRFKAQDLNTSALIFTFLPYHSLKHSHYTSQAFAALLTILPAKLPDAFRFLEQTKQKSSAGQPLPLPPTIHTLVAVATQNGPFFSSFNAYTIASYRKGYGYEKLATTWNLVTSGALAGRIDRAGTRKEARRQQEEDIVRQMIPVLNDGLALKNASDVRVACYTILTVLVTKIQLADRTLDVFMNAVTDIPMRLGHPEIICLGVLAAQKQGEGLPKKTSIGLLRDTNVVGQLSAVDTKFGVVKGLAMGLVRHICSEAPPSRADCELIIQILQADLISAEDLEPALATILPSIQGTEREASFAEVLQTLSLRHDLPKAVQSTLSDAGYTQDDREPAGLLEDIEAGSDDSEMEVDPDTKFDEALSLVMKQTVDSSPITFLSGQPSATYDLLARTATLAGKSQIAWDRLSGLRCFHIKNKENLYVSFLLRLCSTSPSPAVRASALTRLTEFVQQQQGNDFQLLLPYCLVFLADASPLARKAAGAFLVAIQESFGKMGKSHVVIPKNDLHASGPHLLLSKAEVGALLRLLVQNLEEYGLDASHGAKVIRNALSGQKTVDKKELSLKSADREAILHFLAAAIAATPLINVRVHLVKILDGVSKVGSTSKTKALLPFLRQETQEAATVDSRLVFGASTSKTYWRQMLATISGSSGDGLKLLKDLIDDADGTQDLREAAILRTKDLWSVIKPEKQTQLAVSLFDLVCNASHGSSSELGDTATGALRSLKLPVAALRGVLELLPTLVDFVGDSTSSVKRRRTSNGRVDGENPDVTGPLQQWAFALELVDLSRDRGDQDLLKKLNKMLVEVQSLTSQLGSQSQYVVAVLLDSLNGVVSELAKATSEHTKTPAIPVDALIEIFQTSSSAQVQRSALLLISTLASVYPDAIMHHIMPVFTTMGQSVLKHGDEFSIHVADLAIKSIIPPLLSSFRKQKSGFREGMVRVLVSFVVAYDHIPQARRLPLFSSLAEQLGADHSLHLLALLFIDKHGRSKGTEDFVVDLLSKHNAVTQLQALRNAVEIVHDACSETPTTLTSQIIPSKERKARLTTALQYALLASRALQNSGLQRNVEGLLSKDNDNSQVLRGLYSELIERVLRLQHSVQFQKKLYSACGQFLDSLLKLLPIHETISGLQPLLDSNDVVVQRQVLKSIDDRVGTIRTKDNPAQQACLGLLPQMDALLQGRDTKLSQTIISCTDSIIERFGKKNPSQALPILETIASAQGLSSQDDDVKIMSLFCLATAVQTLGESVAKLLPQIIRLTFEVADIDLSGAATRSASVLNAAFALFAAILDNLSWAMGKNHIQKLLHLATAILMHSDLAANTAEDRASTLELLAKRTEAPACIGALAFSWKTAMKVGTQAMLQQLRVMQTLLATLSKSNTAKSSQNLLDYFLLVLNTGSHMADGSSAVSPTVEADDLEEVEDLCSEIIMQMVYKLNDTHFRPIFVRLVEWASETQGASGVSTRHAALYKFLYRFFDTLKSIVTSYAGLILEDAAQMLTSPPKSNESHSMLWVRLIQTLRAAFENDQDEYFQAPSRFGLILTPLVKQLEDPMVANHEELAPCIVAFASVADSSENQKEINNAVLGHLRSEDRLERLAAVDCQRQLTEALSDEWLAHLPEMLPLISEVLEDDDEDVQNATRAWVSRIEAIIGESLGPMLQ